tara:strand:+ start:3655 stop:4398 length:744 start_codon:yes stop_codon:yes gene_type:complete
MDFKTIKSVQHYVYDNIKEFEAFQPNKPLVYDWRLSNEGDWVLTDDDFVCQILKKGNVGTTEYVRTVLGMFSINNNNVKMLGDEGIVENIYSFSGNYKAIQDYKKSDLNAKETLFARYIASGVDAIESFRKVYPNAKKESYIKDKTQRLLKKENVQKMIKEEIKEVLAEEGVTPEWIIAKYRDIVDLSERDTDKLRSLDALSKIAGLFDTEQKKEQLTVWAGFSPEQLEAINNGGETKLIGHQDKKE